MESDRHLVADRFDRVLPGGAGNRLGYGHVTGFQLKIVQEVVTLAVFMGFAIAILKERLAWNYVAAFVFLGITPVWISTAIAKIAASIVRNPRARYV